MVLTVVPVLVLIAIAVKMMISIYYDDLDDGCDVLVLVLVLILVLLPMTAMSMFLLSFQPRKGRKERIVVGGVAFLPLIFRVESSIPSSPPR